MATMYAKYLVMTVTAFVLVALVCSGVLLYITGREYGRAYEREEQATDHRRTIQGIQEYLQAKVPQPAYVPQPIPAMPCPAGALNCGSFSIPSLAPGESVKVSMRIVPEETGGDRGFLPDTAQEVPIPEVTAAPIVFPQGTNNVPQLTDWHPRRVNANCYLRYCRTASGEWVDCTPSQEKEP